MNILDLMKKFSYDEREKRRLEKYLSKKQQYSEMSNDELEMNYIKITSIYEHKKLVLITVMSTIFISILSNVWSYFFNIIREFLIYMYTDTGQTEAAQTALVATLVIAITFFIIMLIIIIDFFRIMKKITEEKLFIERLINKRND